VPGDRRSIRDIPLSREKIPRKREEVPVKIHKTEARDVRGRSESTKRIPIVPPQAENKKPRRKGVWLITTLGIVVLIVVAAFLASTYFSRAVFTITPKTASVSVNASHVVKYASSSAAGDLTYEVITMKGSDSVIVPATDGPAVSTKAEGNVILFNAFSASSIRLIAGTRLANDSGLVYRLKSSVVIPGYTKPSGSVIAGSVAVRIIADQAGSEYNISRSDSLSDFKIVAYKGSSKYDSVYARLTSDVVGGYVGTKKNVSQATLASSTAALKSAITTSLLTQIRSSVPTGYVMYDSSYSSSFTAPEVGGTDKGKATITLNGTVYGIILKETDLVSKLAGVQTVQSFGDFGYVVAGLKNLSFNISNIKDFAPDKKGTLIILLKGDMKLIGNIPVTKLKADLAGKSLAESQTVLKTFSQVIENADGELVPPWSKIPSDEDRIIVKVR